MAGSTLSLDSLSSPSPSPSPPRAGKKQLPATSKSTSHKEAPTLDSDSELSELTEDDQDGNASADRRERPATATAAPAVASTKVVSPTSAAPSAVPSAASSTSAEGHGNTTGTSTRSQEPTSKRGHIRTKYNMRRGLPRKKRSSIVPAPMWGWAEAKAATSSAPVEEEEEEMAGPPRAMEEEEEEPDEPEEEEEDDTDNREDSAGLDEEDGFVSQRRLGPYVTQRLPGIRSIYTSSGRARHGRRQIPVSSRKFDAEDAEPPINGADHENGSASGSEYNSPRKKRTMKPRPPASAGSRKRKGSAPRESSGSDHPPSSRKAKKVQQRDDDDDDGVASDASTPQHQTGDEKTTGEVKTSPQIPVSPSKFLPSSKPLSTIATSTINPAAAALAALAVIADSVENNTETTLDLKNTISSSSSARKSPLLESSLPATSTSSAVEATPAVSQTASPDNSDGDEELTEPQPTYRNKRTRRAPPRSKKPSDDWRRLVKPPVRSPNSKKLSIDLKIDNGLDDTPDEPAVKAINDTEEGMDVDPDVEEVNDGEKNADLDAEEDEADEEVSQQDEDTQPIDDTGEGDDEPVDPEGEGDGDEDQEQDLETNEVENEQDNENDNENDEEENEEEPLPDGDLEDQEIELQPAHRAEALDVLASIELKFAMLRERVYLEKMEVLGWEELMVQASVHPEMQYLQKEMTKRRDKRLELASRKRSYEVKNATKRRQADEDGVWSWWKLTVDELQTEMIAETNRKRRKLERERRALERPHPVRRIPLPPTDLHLLPQPSLRKLLKTYPFGVHKPMKRRRHRHSRVHQPKSLVYPEIPTLSVMDINHDLEFLYQNRRVPSTYDMPFGGPPPLWGQAPAFPHRSGLSTPGGLPGLGRPVGLGLGPSNGALPSASQNQAAVGLSQPSILQHHPLAYEQYPEASAYGGTRMRDVYTHGPAPPPHTSSRDPYLGYPGHPTRNHPSPSHPSTPNMAGSIGYPTDHEMGPMPPGGHQMVQNPIYFGHANAPPPSFPPSSHGSNLKGVSNGRPLPPSPPHLANGVPSSKSNGSWMTPAMGMGSFQIGGSNGKGGDRDARTVHDDDERDRLARERDRKRAERDNIERRDYWEKEYPDADRDRRELPYVHSVQYGHGSGAPTPVPGVDAHQLSSHHHRNHHHHVLHRHGPPHPPSSLPSPVHPGSGGAPPIVHSPRSTRDFDIPGSSSSVHPTTDGMIISSSGNKSLPLPRERDYQWSQRNMDTIHHSPSMHDYRDRDKDLRKSYSHRPSSRPGLVDDRGDRPTSSPFVIASASVPPSVPPSSHMNGSNIGVSDSSLKGQTMWNEDPSYRMPPSGYLGGLSSHEAHRSPIQAHRYTPGAPSGRGLPPANSIHRIVSPPPPVNRTRPPPSPYSHSSNLHRSPPASPRLPPRSPKPLGSGRTVTPTGQRPSSSHTPSSHPSLTPLDSHLKNGTTSNYPLGGRTESPHISALHVPSNRQGLNGNGGLNTASDVDRHAISAMSPRLAPPVGQHPSKLNATPVTDRR